MLCEMCGKNLPELNTVKIEGATLKLCPPCSRFGTIIDSGENGLVLGEGEIAGSPSTARLLTAQKKREERDLYAELPPLELDPDWFRKIRMARDARGLTQEAFGSLLNEKSSVVHKLEGGAIQPSDALVRKIERALKIQLRQPADDS